MEREYLFGVISVVWQEATHGGSEEEIVNRAINAIMSEIAAQQGVQADGADSWVCQECQTDNPIETASCNGCGSPRR